MTTVSDVPVVALAVATAADPALLEMSGAPGLRAGLLGLSADGSLRFRVALPSTGGVLRPHEDEHGVLAASGGSLLAVNAADGTLRWQVDGLGAVDRFWACGGVVVALCDQLQERPRFVALNRADARELWARDLPRHAFGDARPTEDGALAWVGQDGPTRVVELATGADRWTHPGTWTFPGFDVLGDTLIRTSEDVILAFDTASGDLRWRSPAVTIELWPSFQSGLVMTVEWDAARGDYCSVVVREPGGAVRWRRTTQGCASIIADGDGRALILDVGAATATVVDLVDGDPVWSMGTRDVLDLRMVGRTLVTVEGRREQPTIVARSLSVGRELWRAPLDRACELLGPGDRGGIMVAPDEPVGQEQVVVLDLSSGKVRSRTTVWGYVRFIVSSPRGLLVAHQDPARLHQRSRRQTDPTA